MPVAKVSLHWKKAFSHSVPTLVVLFPSLHSMEDAPTDMCLAWIPTNAGPIFNPLAARVDLLRPINLRVVRQCDGRALMAPFAWKATTVDEILDARRVEAHVVPHMEAVICTNCNGVDAKPLLFGALPSIAHGWSRERARRSS